MYILSDKWWCIYAKIPVFIRQYKQVESILIIKKHWSIVKRDITLNYWDRNVFIKGLQPSGQSWYVMWRIRLAKLWYFFVFCYPKGFFFFIDVGGIRLIELYQIKSRRNILFTHKKNIKSQKYAIAILSPRYWNVHADSSVWQSQSCLWS